MWLKLVKPMKNIMQLQVDKVLAKNGGNATTKFDILIPGGEQHGDF